jgi:hypothetical protein
VLSDSDHDPTVGTGTLQTRQPERTRCNTVRLGLESLRFAWKTERRAMSEQHTTTASPDGRPTDGRTDPDRADTDVRWFGKLPWFFLLLIASGGIYALTVRFSYLLLVFAVINKTVILFLFLLLIIPFLYGWVGRGLGITNLFWNDEPVTRFNAAAAVTIYLAIVATLMFLSYKLDPASRSDRWGMAEAQDPIHEFPAQFHAFLILLGGFALPLVLLPAIVPSWRLFRYVPRFAPRSLLRGAKGQSARPVDVVRDPKGWVYGFVVWTMGVVAGMLAAAFMIGFMEWIRAGFCSVGSKYYISNTYIIWLSMFLFIYVSIGSFAYRAVSPPVAICALLAFIAFIYAAFDDLPEGVAVWWGVSDTYAPLVRVGVLLIVLVLWCGTNQDPFRLSFPNMGDYYNREQLVKLNDKVKDTYIRENRAVDWRAQTGDNREVELVRDDEVLKKWLRNVTGKAPDVVKGLPLDERPKLALVAVSGGATRSAIWTAVVLDRIEQVIPKFRQHLRIITGASGGMLGAAYFLKDWRDYPSGSSTYEQRPSPWVDRIPQASIGRVARFIAMRDVWRAFLPQVLFPKDDRGIALEEDWKDIGFSIQSLLCLEQAGKIPSMILSPMIVEDGRRLLISNLDLWDMTLVKGSALTFDDPGSLEYPYSLSALEFFRLFPKAKDFQLATGVRMSASFPYVSPAVTLPTDPPRRVVDAGYYDNYGVQVATAWVQKNRDWLEEHTSGVVLIQIRDSISQKDRLEVDDAPTGFWAWLARGFRFFTSPVDAVASARYASTLFRNDQDVWELSTLFDLEDPLRTNLNKDASRPLDRPFFTTVAFENSAYVTTDGHSPGTWPGDDTIEGEPGDVALNWYLSDAEKAGLIRAIPPEPEAGSRWLQSQCRRERIEQLTKDVDEAKAPDRDGRLKQLEQAKNYERLVVLREWWNNPKTGEYRPRTQRLRSVAEPITLLAPR